jgi:hypothetical protein
MIHRDIVQKGTAYTFMAGPRRAGDVVAAHLKEALPGNVPPPETAPIVAVFEPTPAVHPVDGDVWMYTLSEVKVNVLDPAKVYVYNERCENPTFGNGQSQHVALVVTNVATVYAP